MATQGPRLEAAYQRYFPIIRDKCRRMLSTHADAQDVAQETFIRLWKSGLATEAPAIVTAWVFRTSTRLAIDHLRRRRRAAPAPASAWASDEGREPVSEEHGAGDLEAALAARQQLEALAREVPRRELEMAILSRVDGLTQLEIAEVLDTSERTVRRVLTSFDARAAALEASQEPSHG
jgi:RNA polymerase sigma-70 factor, ECF subfamily